jgi:flavin-dependent dehydrogenase
MKKNHHEFDAVVVGAGTSGASAACHLARAGFSTALLDAGPFKNAGARWMNALPSWMFDLAGFEHPEPPELHAKDFPISMRDSKGNERLRIPINPIWELDMRALVKRLQGLARESGVIFFERVHAGEFVCENERPTILKAIRKSPKGSTTKVEFRAKLFVDATGLAGVLRTAAPSLAKICPPASASDQCAAAHFVYRINDQGGARRYLEKMDCPSGASINYFSVDGGFSTLMVNTNLEKKDVAILGGTTAEKGRKTGRVIVEDFVKANSWIGKALFGGQAMIPIRRPYDRFAAPGIALVGDAACQVFPAHGSGVGSGMIAGKMLADAAKGQEDPGSLEATWNYQATFMRKIGAVNAAYDVFRKAVQKMDSVEMDRMVSASLLLPGASRKTLDQKMPSFEMRDQLPLMRAVSREPLMVARFIPAAAKMQAVHALYKKYPLRPDERLLWLWAKAAATLFGSQPDFQ